MPDPTPPLVLSGRTHEGRPTYGPMQRCHLPAEGTGWMWMPWLSREGGSWLGDDARDIVPPTDAVEALPPEDWRPEMINNPYAPGGNFQGNRYETTVGEYKAALAKAWNKGRAATSTLQQESTVCPYVVTSDEGTSFCRLAESKRENINKPYSEDINPYRDDLIRMQMWREGYEACLLKQVD